MPDDDELANGALHEIQPSGMAILTTFAEASGLAITVDERDEWDATNAAARLAQETRRTMKFAGRGVSDVTEAFATAAEKLPPGELVKDDFFTLFEAVGALEVWHLLYLHSDTCRSTASCLGLLMNVDRSWTPRWTVATYRLMMQQNLDSMSANIYFQLKSSGSWTSCYASL
jgi:hypothetical protein